jgi:hypothetical protein
VPNYILKASFEVSSHYTSEMSLRAKSGVNLVSPPIANYQSLFNFQKLTFTAWMHGQPDNTGGNENYIAIHKQEWNDVPKHGHFGAFHVVGYICEWKDK